MANAVTQDVAVVFSPVIEGFFRTYGNRLTPQVRKELSGLGIDFERVLPAYSMEVFEGAMRRMGEAIYPELELSERWRRMGREFVEGYGETMIGKAVLMMGKALGPRRMLQRIARAFSTGANYLEVETTELGPTEIQVRTWMRQPYLEVWSGREMLHLDYRLGLLEAAMQILGTRDPSVTMLDKDFKTQSARYLVRWSE